VIVQWRKQTHQIYGHIFGFSDSSRRVRPVFRLTPVDGCIVTERKASVVMLASLPISAARRVRWFCQTVGCCSASLPAALCCGIAIRPVKISLAGLLTRGRLGLPFTITAGVRALREVEKNFSRGRCSSRNQVLSTQRAKTLQNSNPYGGRSSYAADGWGVACGRHGCVPVTRRVVLNSHFIKSLTNRRVFRISNGWIQPKFPYRVCRT
jgi:hypothetical protein